jgi:cytochrome P450
MIALARSRRPAALPPGPGFNPWRLWAFVQRPVEEYARLRQRYGDLVTLTTSDMKLVLAMTPDGAREVLTADPDGYDASHKREFSGLTGPGSVWIMDGARHRRERQLLAPAFHLQRVREYGRTMQALARQRIDRWQPGQEVTLYHAMLDISREVILRIVFGIGDGPLRAEGHRVMSELLHLVRPIFVRVAAFQSWWFPPWRRYQRAKAQFEAFAARCLAEHRARADRSGDVVDLMLAARDEAGAPLPDAEIVAELGTIAFSGHETTAVGLCWALYELARHPAVLERMRAEIDALGPVAEPDQIARLPYLTAVCNETLRLHSILTEIARVTRTPFQLGGYTLPPGVTVGIGICGIHHDPSVYPEPERFRPERFLERTYSPFEFLPFGGGHRRCMGAALSDYEMRIVLATIVTRWDFAPTRDDWDVRHNIGMGPKHGVPMRVGQRRRAITSSAAKTSDEHVPGARLPVQEGTP